MATGSAHLWELQRDAISHMHRSRLTSAARAAAHRTAREQEGTEKSRELDAVGDRLRFVHHSPYKTRMESDSYRALRDMMTG